MIAPREYSRFCGPRAMAAVLGRSAEECAELLWPLRFFWWADGPALSASATGDLLTPPFAVEDLLLRFGFGIDAYRDDGRMSGDTEVIATAARQWAEERIYEVRPALRQVDRAEISPGRRSLRQWLYVRVKAMQASLEATVLRLAGLPGRRSLRQWLYRHRFGLWLYLLENDEAEGHIIACEGSRILTGESLELLAGWKVVRALRVHPPQRWRES